MVRAEIARRLPVLQHGFRPFFLLGALWAALALSLWLAALAAGLDLPTAMEPLAWHRHELLFGYLVAIVAAFLFTALALVFAREILAGRNWRNLPVVVAVALLALADLLSHLESLRALPADMMGDRLAIAVMTALVALIGGRITPSFTTNWLKERGAVPLPAPFGRLDGAVMVLTVLALLTWLVWPEGEIPALLLLAAAAGAAVRLARWRGAATTREPLLLVLHLGYAWLALGLTLLGLAALGLLPRSAALHALTAGAFGTMTLAVMTRAALGHTGRALTADAWTTAIYAMVNLGALARLAAFWAPAAYLPSLQLAGLLWGGAFLTYALRYGPILLGPDLAPGAPVGAPGSRVTGSRSPA